MESREPQVYISPNFTSDKLDAPSVDDLIDVYEDRVMNWILRPAMQVAEAENGAAAGLCLLLTYFEGAWAYKTCESSEGRSKEFFIAAFVDVFASPHHPEALVRKLGTLLYKNARCGFFHDGLFRDRIYIAAMNRDIVITLPRTGGVLDLEAEIESALIDVLRCIKGVERHFASAIRALRDPLNVTGRERFARFFKERCDWEADGPVVALQ